MCKHYYPWVILSGVVKNPGLSPLFSMPDTQTSKHDERYGQSGDKRQSEAGGKAMEMEQMFVRLLICGLIRVLHRQLELMAC